MAREIERKFLVKHLPIELDQFEHADILQGYFSDPSTGKSVRLRKIGDTYVLTRKKGSGLVKDEKEETISKEEFDNLWSEVENRFLKKVRYYIPYNGITIELDIYENLGGLQTAEVEFSTKRDAKQFIAPARFAEELTTIREATNAYIATHGIDGELLALISNG